MNNKKALDVVVVGFALFSMFFGAGNLLFPPYLGLVSGTNWIVSLSGFILTDIILALVVVMAAVKFDGDLDLTLSRAGKKFARAIIIASILCIGPLLAIPRNGATTYEMGIAPILGFDTPVAKLIVSIIFFGLTLLLTIRPSKVVDIIGKFLTPALLVCLAILIIMGIINPIGDLSSSQLIENNLFAEGVAQGYQTLDTLAAVAFSTVAITAIIQRGYSDSKEKVKLTLQSGLISGVFLALVYAGLTYLGSMLSTTYGVDTPQASLMVVITNAILGKPGKIILGIIVSLACLTTSIGLTSSAASYFSNISNGKVKYQTLVIGICVFSLILANFGVSTIIQFSAPVLEIVCPVLVALIATTFLDKYIKNDNAFKGVAYVTLLVSILSVGSSLFNITQVYDLLSKLPLAQYGFNWVLPAILGGVIGNFIKTKKNVNSNQKAI
ncbi:MAG: branched-chain amino acid transport system II carrier protein [Intestinibacter bartlettii]